MVLSESEKTQLNNKTKKKRKDEEILKTSVDTEAFDDSKMSDNENPKLSFLSS